MTKTKNSRENSGIPEKQKSSKKMEKLDRKRANSQRKIKENGDCAHGYESWCQKSENSTGTALSACSAPRGAVDAVTVFPVF
jgi:hypothetical protein